MEDGILLNHHLLAEDFAEFEMQAGGQGGEGGAPLEAKRKVFAILSW